jgi:ABC-type transport system substrate-binding protein
VKFHDGAPFDAKAVEANFKRFAQQRLSTLQFVEPWFQSLEIIDDFTVRIRLKEVYTPFLTEMAQIICG